MAIELISIGQTANDGTGDDLREAFIKVNRNFEDLDLRDNEKTTVSNTGSGEGIFDDILKFDIRLKSIAAGKDISVTSTEDGEIVISNTQKPFTEISITTEDGQYAVQPGQQLNIYGLEGIDTYVQDNAVYIKNSANTKVQADNDPVLGGSLDANGLNISNASVITANSFIGSLTGNVTGTINGVNPATIAPYFDNYYDFGEMSRTVNGILDWLIEDANVDFGTFLLPDLRTIELGSIA